MFAQLRMFAILFLGLSAITLTLTGCETLDGAGRDIEKAGEAVQDAAN